mgnify:CR=1 FL=1
MYLPTTYIHIHMTIHLYLKYLYSYSCIFLVRREMSEELGQCTERRTYERIAFYVLSTHRSISIISISVARR